MTDQLARLALESIPPSLVADLAGIDPNAPDDELRAIFQVMPWADRSVLHALDVLRVECAGEHQGRVISVDPFVRNLIRTARTFIAAPQDDEGAVRAPGRFDYLMDPRTPQELMGALAEATFEIAALRDHYGSDEDTVRVPRRIAQYAAAYIGEADHQEALDVAAAIESALDGGR